MRLTTVLCRQHLGWHFKQKWKYQSKRKIIDMGIPKVLLENYVPVYDPKDILVKPLVKDKVIVPEPFAKDPLKSFTPTHPNWKEKSIFLVQKYSKLLEGTAHIELLTKTVEYRGVPPAVSALMDQGHQSQNDLVKNEILRALVLNGIQVRLPKRVDITRPGYGFSREYGIDHKTKMTGLLHKLLQLCEKASARYDHILKRSTLLERKSKVFVEKDEDLLLFHMPSDVLITSDQPLAPFFSKEETEKTRQMPVPDLYPLKCTIDLSSTNIYTTDETIVITPQSTSHLHTLYITHDTIFYWKPDQKLARAIATCFCFSAAEAHKLYGALVMDLPQPVNVQCVCLDDNNVSFVAYQLNSLNISGEEGLKNQVWIDGPHKLFDTYSYEDNVQGYNPDVFSKLLAFYLNSA